MKRSFTLLEVMIAFVLLAMSASIIGIQMRKAIQKKKFHTEVERFRDRLSAARGLAVAMEADWKGSFRKDSKKWLFQAKCIEPEIRELKLLKVDTYDVSFNGKRIDNLEFDFYSTGFVEPEGILRFSLGDESIYWHIPNVIQESVFSSAKAPKFVYRK